MIPLIVLIVVFILSPTTPEQRRGPKPKPTPTPVATPTPTPVPAPIPAHIEPVSRSAATLSLDSKYLTINAPPNTVTGDFLIAHLGGVPGAITLSTPAGWTFLRQDYNNTLNPFTGYANYRASIYYKVVTADEPDAYTWTLSSAPLGYSGAITAYRGVDPFSPIDAHAATQSGITSIGYLSPEISATTPNTYLLLLISIDAFALTPDNRGCLPVVGMEQRYQVLNSDNFIAGMDGPRVGVGLIGPIAIKCTGNGAPAVVAAVLLR